MSESHPPSGFDPETSFDIPPARNSDPAATIESSASFHNSPLDGTPVVEPTSIGPYKFIRRLGEGGMGQVWQHSPT